MNFSKSSALSLLAFTILSAGASAQATRTWISGVGDDANPCSRTAPCKTFAGAISKTASGGEIDVLDPGGFGTLTITKAITIDGGGVIGSILATATNGININAGTGDAVTIRNMSINGAAGISGTPGLIGIQILQAGTVNIQNSVIFGFSTAGINVAGGGTAVNVDGVKLHGNAGGITVNGSGITRLTVRGSSIVNNSGTGISLVSKSRLSLSDSILSVNGAGGVSVTGNSTASIAGGVASANGGYGYSVAGPSTLNLLHATVSGNAGPGVIVDSSAGMAAVNIFDTEITSNGGAGILAQGAGTSGKSVITLSNVHSIGNTSGLSGVTGTAHVASYGDNVIADGLGGATLTPFSKQ